MRNEEAYWITLAHLPRWGYAKINNIIAKFHHDYKISITEFFQLSDLELRDLYSLEEKDIISLNQAKLEIPNNAFIAESLVNEGYELIPIISSEYSNTLKENLKLQHSPSLLYIKGDKNILQENSIAIVGSRDASEISLQFADNIAKMASKEYKVVVSGFAKGVDKQALDSVLKYNGRSIIVLPQGIATFDSGFRTYYKPLVSGDLLVLSVFPPKATWNTGFAMARNPIIYGLADEIYVAESSDKGGTWSGAIDGLKKGRNIYVRNVTEEEINANQLLIEKGGIAIDNFGERINTDIPKEELEIDLVNEPKVNYEDKIVELLYNGQYAVKDIIKILKLDLTEKKVRDILKQRKDVEITCKKPLKFTMKDCRVKQITIDM
ncbi:MAG: DNA-processing protein DprA [Bacteroidales bacterium]|nr:DNA-processing protein DprA [Bacteroidales bacterium]